MKNILVAAAFALTALSVPALSFAQSSVTRASVEAQLSQLEKAGYNVGGDDANYPADIQAAEAKVALGATPPTPVSAKYSQGSSVAGTSVAGASYAHDCVGPISFCDTYFGS
jgi:hypothetical protein